MTAPFECEVRFLVGDIEAFHRRLGSLGGRVVLDYAFTDHYLRPSGRPWDPRQRALRIREHHVPASGGELLLTHVEMLQVDGLPFKRSRFAEGKVRLYAGGLEACRRVAEGLGFEPWITVRKRDGQLFEIPGFGELVTEHVEGVGWMCEVEEAGGDPRAAVSAIRRKLEALGVTPEQVMAEPVAALVSAAAGQRPSKVYFCGSIRGGRTLQPLYRAIVDFLQDRGLEVLTTHVAAVDVLAQELRDGLTAADIYARDLRWLAECDLVIAEVSTPSLGVGVEITEAQRMGKPILALARSDVQLSAMIAGNPGLRVLTYADEADLFRKLAAELETGPWRRPQRLRAERERGAIGSA